jgi:repressor LexA
MTATYSLPRLTSAQRRIAEGIAAAELNGRPAFAHELVAQLGLAGESSLTPTLKLMEQRGFIEIAGGGKQRAYRVLQLTKAGRQALGMGGLPVLGSIPAGPLAEALAQPADFIEPGRLLPHRAGDFLLRVRGDSMIGDGIHDGDLVLLRPDVDVQPGEIAAVHTGDSYESTLKHVHFEQEGVRLRASNPAYPDLFIAKGEWRGVAGVYRGLVRHAGR